MIDTVKLKSPYLTPEVAALVELQLTRRSAVKLDSGEVLYEITSGELEGSFDNRIMVRLCREELVSVKLDRAGGRKVRGTDKFVQLTSMAPCEPYLLIEGSVHKAMVGHNITGGPQNFRAAACWFVNEVAVNMLAVALPHGDNWIVERVDVTETYQLPFVAIEEYIGSLNRLEFPRRKRSCYGLESLYFSGTTTTFSLYHKGPEFAKHDAKKLRDRLTPEELFDLQALANGIMRMEVKVKGKKLRADVESGLLGVKGERVRVVQVTDAYLQRVHDSEVARVIREGHQELKTVRIEKEVYARLNEKHGSRLAAPLYALWVRLAAHGEKEVRRDMDRTTFYRQRKQLVGAGCSWAGTDIVIKHSSIPVGFSLRRCDSRRDTLENPRISELLAPWRQAV